MKKTIQLFSVIFLTVGLASCIKDKYDAPPTGGTDPDITVNFTIQQLKTMYAGTIMRITDSLVISGVVTADEIGRAHV